MEFDDELDENPAPPPPPWPKTAFAAMQATPQQVAAMRSWLARTYPPGTPIATRRELQFFNMPVLPPGARGVIVDPAPFDDEVADRAHVEIVDARDAEGIQIAGAVGELLGISYRDMRPLVDHWASAPRPRGRRALPHGQRARLKPNEDDDLELNPIPPPPQNRMDWWAWVQRTFPEGTPVIFAEELVVDPPLTGELETLVPAGTKAVVHEHHHGRAPGLTVRLRAPIAGTSDPEVVRIDERLRELGITGGVTEWDIWLEPFELVQDQILRPLVDTWGPTAAPLGRHALPRSQRARLKPNEPRGAMQRARFGREVDHDGGAGAERYRIFHDKDPQRVVEIAHPFPEQVGLAGDALSVLYRTDKWHEDGDDTDYKHVFDEGVKVYEPLGAQSWLEPAKLPRKPRGPLALLGQCIGLFLERADDGEVYEAHLPRSRDTWLFAAPDGRMLYVYDPREGFRAVIAGGQLTVEEEGIDH